MALDTQLHSIQSPHRQCQPPPVTVLAPLPSQGAGVSGNQDICHSEIKLSPSPLQGAWFHLYRDLTEESSKEPVCLLGGEMQNSSAMPLTIWRNSEPTFLCIISQVACGFASIYCAQGKLQVSRSGLFTMAQYSTGSESPGFDAAQFDEIRPSKKNVNERWWWWGGGTGLITITDAGEST